MFEFIRYDLCMESTARSIYLISIIDVAKSGITRIRRDENTPVSLQLMFWSPWKREKFEEKISNIMQKIRGLEANTMDYSTILLSIDKDNIKARALIQRVNYHDLQDLSSDAYLVIITGKREGREKLAKILRKLGMRRGWLNQVFIKKFDELISSNGLRFELLSLVYELRMYMGTLFTAAGTANFWPKGVGSIKEALEEYLSPIEKTRGYYVFIKSLRFKILRNGESIGRYSIDRWGRITVAPRSDIDTILTIFPVIAEDIVRNYVKYMLHYSVKVGKVKQYTAYYLEKATSVYLSAVDPGRDFFNAVKLMVGKPSIWHNKLIILPVEIGNPRLVSRVIDKETGAAVTLIATYNGIRLLPAPGSEKIDAEMIDNILGMFRNLVSE